MTLWSDDTAASTELWAALTGEKKHISEDKNTYKPFYSALRVFVFRECAFYSILVEEPLCTGAIQTHSGIYITQGNLPSCLTHLIFMHFVRDIEVLGRQIHRSCLQLSRSEPCAPPAHWNGLNVPHLGLFIQQLFKLSLVTVGFHHNTHQIEVCDKKSDLPAENDGIEKNPPMSSKAN